MSTAIVLKDGNTLLLATDSRFMEADCATIASDAMRKIFEIGPDTFIAPSGYLGPCDFQVMKARELATTTTDVRRIGEALAQESIGPLEQLAETLASLQHVHEKISGALAGELQLHATVLAGRTADGSLGYVAQAYYVRNGRVTCETTEYFGDAGQLHTTSGPPAEAAVAADPTIFAGEPIEVVRKLLAALRRKCPNIGGPDQIVQIDDSGVRWISEPPAETPITGELQSADALFAGRATFSYKNGAVEGGKVTIDNLGITLQDKITSPTATLAITASGLTLAKAGATLTMDATGVSVAKGSSSVTVTASAVTIVNGSLTSPAISGGSLTIPTALGGSVSIGPLTNGVSCVTASNSATYGPLAMSISGPLSQSISCVPGSVTVATGTSVATLSNYGLRIDGLSSSNPGAGSKAFWYDPADGNRVKFAA